MTIPNSSSRLPRAMIALAVFAVLAVLGWFGMQALAPQQNAPQVQLTLLSGDKLRTADLAGKVAVINFWATSCATCVKEMPQMVQTYEALRDKGLELVAVAMRYDPPMYVTNFAETRKLPFQVAMDSDGSAASAFGNVQLTPTTFVLDKRGRIVKRYVGEPDWDEFRKLLDQALAETV